MIVLVGGVPTQLTAKLTVASMNDPVIFQNEVASTPLPRNVSLDFGSTLMVTQIHPEVKNTSDGEPAHVHVWEVSVQ